MRLGKKASFHDENKFDGPGVDFKSKLIGIAEVSAPRGDDITQEAISELKATALKNHKEKKEHKQKIIVNITLKGIRLIDETSERIDHAHPIHRISFISHDKSDKRAFGYIVGTKDGYKLFAIKTSKEAELITATLKDLFQEVYKRHQALKAKKQEEEGEDATEEVEEKKSEDETEANGQIEVAEEAVESTKELDDSQLIWDELNDQIKEMQSLGGIPHSDSFDMVDDPFNIARQDTGGSTDRSDPFDDNFTPVTTTQKSANPFDDLRNDDDEKIDFLALPTPDEIRKNNNNSEDLFSVEPAQQPTNTPKFSDDLYAVPTLTPPSTSTPRFSDDLYAVPTPPPSSIRRYSDEVNEIANETPLMKHDPFDELKKSINELHKQNIMQQQHQQMPFLPTFPSQLNQQVPVPINRPNPYMPNPFMVNNGFSNNSLPPPIPARPTPPVVPSRPGVTTTNPFLSQQQTSNQTNGEPVMGWTVLDPAPTIKKEVVKKNAFASDPFSFLDDQPGLKVTSPPMAATSNHFANNELLDLLG